MSDGLQVELFHPESDRSVGDTNKELLGGRFDIHPVVFPGAIALIAVFVAVVFLLGSQAEAAFAGTKSFIESTFGWFYLL
ncbi:glycine/betaine ABC transporter, partial [Halobacteriales archaeon QS_8_65_32]